MFFAVAFNREIGGLWLFVKLSELQGRCSQNSLEMLSEGCAVSISDSLDYLVDGEIGFGEQGASVLYSHVLQIGLEGNSDQRPESSANKGRIEKSLAADVGQRDVLHIIFVYVISNINDDMASAFLPRNLFFHRLDQNFGNIAPQQITIAGLALYVGHPAFFKYILQLFFFVEIACIDGEFINEIEMKICEDQLYHVVKRFVL